ncbi:MAG: AmmeMemoRadiSam system protein B, partial [Gammaproteobacteria bacterium]|nr:AmmeMemoRadiSam system protein B [Gammaproteobacteria bacterium]
MSVRNAAVAGMFYPAGSEQLKSDVDALLEHAPTPAGPVPKAMILPHAGYVYSGPAVAAACKLLQTGRDQIKRVVLFGPAHRVYLEGMAVPGTDAFATPLGTVPLDREVIDNLLTLPGVCESDEAHRDEHSLEVQLPFLQTVLSDFTLVPVVVGRAAPEQVA